jgi:hypothetical protein
MSAPLSIAKSETVMECRPCYASGRGGFSTRLVLPFQTKPSVGFCCSSTCECTEILTKIKSCTFQHSPALGLFVAVIR